MAELGRNMYLVNYCIYKYSCVFDCHCWLLIHCSFDIHNGDDTPWICRSVPVAPCILLEGMASRCSWDSFYLFIHCTKLEKMPSGFYKIFLLDFLKIGKFFTNLRRRHTHTLYIQPRQWWQNPDHPSFSNEIRQKRNKHQLPDMNRNYSPSVVFLNSTHCTYSVCLPAAGTRWARRICQQWLTTSFKKQDSIRSFTLVIPRVPRCSMCCVQSCRNTTARSAPCSV